MQIKKEIKRSVRTGDIILQRGGEKTVRKFNNCTMHRDLRELVNCAAGQYGNKPAFRELNAKREVAEHTFNQLKSDIDALGTKLLDMGLKGKHIALIGESSYNYVVCYLATINGVGVIVPIDKDLTNDDIIKLLYKSDAEAIFFQNHLRKVCPIF